ncbi:MAG: hypothetical protein QOC88_1617 [Mycobacterium sp.]|jgi:hypothetical protein|nr:hypothetical protein [Mycobacterium sp.]MDT7736348.1 hypothetical protein [Mycobacterium sp.]
MLWRVVGVAAGVIGYAAAAGGFELEMRRAAVRSEFRRLSTFDVRRSLR